MRKCQFCGRPISECSGFVNAGDFLKVLNGEITHIEDVREFCGWCDVKMSLEEMRLLASPNGEGIP